jgi:hypothetical protein
VLHPHRNPLRTEAAAFRETQERRFREACERLHPPEHPYWRALTTITGMRLRRGSCSLRAKNSHPSKTGIIGRGWSDRESGLNSAATTGPLHHYERFGPTDATKVARECSENPHGPIWRNPLGREMCRCHERNPISGLPVQLAHSAHGCNTDRDIVLAQPIDSTWAFSSHAWLFTFNAYSATRFGYSSSFGKWP